MAKRIHTIKGPVELEALGLILPHEHPFPDLRGPHVPEYAQGDPKPKSRGEGKPEHWRGHRQSYLWGKDCQAGNRVSRDGLCVDRVWFC